MISGRSIRRWLSVVGLVLFAVGGCGNNDPPNTIEPARDSQGPRWGPLAIVDDPAAEGAATGGGAAGLGGGPGKLHIGADCVTLEVP